MKIDVVTEPLIAWKGIWATYINEGGQIFPRVVSPRLTREKQWGREIGPRELYIWTPEPKRAVCDKAVTHHDAPMPECSCGIYAMSSQMVGLDLRIALSGVVIACENGYRAEWAKITGVAVRTCGCCLQFSDLPICDLCYEEQVASIFYGPVSNYEEEDRRAKRRDSMELVRMWTPTVKELADAYNVPVVAGVEEPRDCEHRKARENRESAARGDASGAGEGAQGSTPRSTSGESTGDPVTSPVTTVANATIKITGVVWTDADEPEPDPELVKKKRGWWSRLWGAPWPGDRLPEA